MTTSRNNTIMSWMAYTEFFYPGCELQPGYFYLSIPELYYIPEDGACIGAAGIDAYVGIDAYSHSNSFGFEMEKDAAGCRAFNRNYIVGGPN